MGKQSGSNPRNSNTPNSPEAAPDRKTAKRQMIFLGLFITLLMLAGFGVGMLSPDIEALVIGGLASLVAVVILWMAVSNLRAAFSALREKNNPAFAAYTAVAGIQMLLVIIILVQLFQ